MTNKPTKNYSKTEFYILPETKTNFENQNEPRKLKQKLTLKIKHCHQESACKPPYPLKP